VSQWEGLCRGEVAAARVVMARRAVDARRPGMVASLRTVCIVGSSCEDEVDEMQVLSRFRFSLNYCLLGGTKGLLYSLPI